MNSRYKTLMALALTTSVASFAGTFSHQTKDIVLDRVASVYAPQAQADGAPPATAAVPSDAMAVSVLLESPDGTLTPKPINTVFHTGDRFRVKVLASRNGKIAFYNTNPAGITGSKPVWSGEVKVGQETISPRLRLDGLSGVDYLHVVLEPQAESNVFAWLDKWLGGKPDSGKPASKDIVLDTQHTDTTTYMLNQAGSGLVSTLRVVHTNR